MILLFVSSVLAAGVHSGIPVHQKDLGEPAFQSAESGWSAPLANGKGMVRVYVGHDEAGAKDWFGRQRESFTKYLTDFNFADEAAGDGTGVLLFRDGNVGVMVRSDDGQALTIATSLRARIADNVPGLAFPTMERVKDGWGLVAPGSVYVQQQGGGNIQCSVPVSAFTSNYVATAEASPCIFIERPDDITVWDAWGRPTVVR